MTVKTKRTDLHVGPSKYCGGGVILFGFYQSGELAMRIVDGLTGVPEATATVSLVPYGAEHPGKFGVWLKGWSENEGLPEALERWGIVKLTGRKHRTGRCEALHAELTDVAQGVLREVFWDVYQDRVALPGTDKECAILDKAVKQMEGDVMAVPSVEEIASKILGDVDGQGNSLALDDWIELLRQIGAGIQERAEAARDDARRD